jgi:uncharacterized protein YycO
MNSNSGSADLSTVDVELLNYVDSSKLRPGDILLSTDPDSAVSNAIRKTTRSRYSHAAIFIGNGEFVEAVGLGVHRFLVDSTAVGNRENVLFLRLKDSVPQAQSIALLAGRKAENYVARRYWLPGAVASRLPAVNLKQRGKFFCSQLVAQAFHEAGLELLDNVKSHKVMPGKLLKSRHLTDITDEVLLPPEPAKRWRPADRLDGRMRLTIHDREVAVRQQVDDRVNKLLRNEGIESDRGLDHVLKILRETDNVELRQRLDLSVVQVLREEGYAALSEVDDGRLLAIQRMPMIVSQMIDAKQPLEKLAEIRDQQHLLQRYLEARIGDDRAAVRSFQQLAERTGCEVFRIHADMRRVVLERLNEIGLCNMLAIATLDESLAQSTHDEHGLEQ